MADRLYRSVAKFLDSQGWSFTRLAGSDDLRWMFQGEHGQWPCVARLREAQAQLMFYSVFPEAVPQAARVDMATLLTRLNYGLIVGNFELGLDDGALRYKTSLDVEGQALTQALVRTLVLHNLLTMDEYLPQLQAAMARP